MRPMMNVVSSLAGPYGPASDRQSKTGSDYRACLTASRRILVKSATSTGAMRFTLTAIAWKLRFTSMGRD